MTSKRPLVCIPLKPRNLLEGRKLISQAQKKADILEIWLDQLEDQNFKVLKDLIKFSKKPLLGVAKTPGEGGKLSAGANKRLNLLLKAIEAGFPYIDAPIDLGPKNLNLLIKNKKQAKIIISYHNFQSTPPLRNLRLIVQKAINFQADIVKIAVFITDYRQNLQLFNLIHEVQKSKKIAIITIGMGEKGKISRLFAPKIDSYMGYFPLSRPVSTAPGQITIDQYNSLEKILF